MRGVVGMVMRACACALAAGTFLTLRDPGLAAQQVSISGQVIEGGSRAAIGGATVELSGRPPVQTGPDGRFRFDAVPAGRHALAVRALGWSPADTAFIVRGDTTIVIALERAPVQLDTLQVQPYTIRVRGVVVDSATGRPLIDVETVGLPDRRTRTDLVGRFRFEALEPGVPFVIRLSEMEYLPQSIAIIATQDTTLRVEMKPDPIAVQLVANAKQKLAERSAPRSYQGLSAITRKDLLLNVNRSVLDVLSQMLRSRLSRVRCWIIDERINHNGRERLETMLPDQVEHIEILSYGTQRSFLMVRVYTRDYFPALLLNSSDALSKDDLTRAARIGRCR